MKSANYLIFGLIIATGLFFAGTASAALINTGPNCSFVNAVISAETNVATGGCVAGSGPSDTVSVNGNQTVSQPFGSSNNAFPIITSPIKIKGVGDVTVTLDNLSSVPLRFFEVSGGSLSLERLSFDGVFNSGSFVDKGALVYAHDNSKISLTRVVTNGMYVSDDGGVVYAENTNIDIKASEFQESSAPNNGGVIYIKDGLLNVHGSSFVGNMLSNEGGAIYMFGEVNTTIQNSLFASNHAIYGGAINAGLGSNEKRLTIVDSTFDFNTTEIGGIVSTRGWNYIVDIRRSTFSNNKAFSDNGSVLTNDNNATISIINSTFSENESFNDASAILNNTEEATYDIAYNTFYGNNSNSSNGVIRAKTLPMLNSVIENNLFFDNIGNDCDFVSTAGVTFVNNLSADAVCGGVAATLVNPSLLNNGGSTKTHALLNGSNAIDAAVTDILLVRNSCPKGDQRIYPRMIDGNNDGILKCDVGAYEKEKKTAQVSPLKPTR